MTRKVRWVIAGGLVMAAVVWVLVNGPYEGAVLLVLSPNHGVTVADLFSVLAVGIAGWLVLGGPRR